MTAHSDKERFHPVVPQRPYRDLSRRTIHRAIDALLQEPGFDQLDILNGISIVPSEILSLTDVSCYQFILGDDYGAEIERLKVEGIRSGHEPGAVAFYFNRGHRAYKLKHVGLVTPTGDILSKWGFDSPVIEHHPDFVPSHYGKIKGYYTDPTNKVLARVGQYLPHLDYLK